MAAKGFWLTGAALSAMATSALAQEPTPPVPVREMIDGNGIDLFRGQFVARQSLVTIGGDQGLSYDVVYRDNVVVSSIYGAIDVSGNVYTVTFDGRTDRFTLANNVFTATERRGQSLTFNASANTYTYVSRDGTVVLFSKNRANTFTVGNTSGNEGRIEAVTTPTGGTLSYAYESGGYFTCTGGGGGYGGGPPQHTQNASYAPPAQSEAVEEPLVEDDADPEPDPLVTPDSASTSSCMVKPVQRVTSVTNEYGYRLNVAYASSDPNDASGGISAWWQITAVSAQNLAGCSATTCTWPSTSTPNVASNSYVRGTDAGATNGSFNRVVAWRRYGDATDAARIQYVGGRVSSVASQAEYENSVATSYAYSDANGERTVTVTNALAAATAYVFDITSERIKRLIDPMGRMTAYEHDTSGRLTKTTLPNGVTAEQEYDVRGNVLKTIRKGRAGTTEALEANWLVTTAQYTDCTSSATCNQPTWITDERGNTNYQYNSDGTLKAVKFQPHNPGRPNPEVRYTYRDYQAKTLNANGQLVDSGIPIKLLYKISQCRTSDVASGCVGNSSTDATADNPGTADERRELFAYDITRNLLPSRVEVRAGDNSISSATSMSYDAIGNLITVDGPNPGTTDVTSFRYDAFRRRVGVISPDPDGPAFLKRRAQRMTYGNDWSLDTVDVGTVEGTTDTDWAAFASRAKTVYAYHNGQVRSATSSVAGNTVAVQHVLYDLAGRQECVAQRLNPAVWHNFTQACTLQADGPDGPDRITKNWYNPSGQLFRVTEALGTGVQAIPVRYMFNSDGSVEKIGDARANWTSYEYDGFGRMTKVLYPTPADVTPNSDYEEYTYGPKSRLIKRRLRDGSEHTFTYNATNLPTWKGRTDMATSNIVYDNFGNVINVTPADRRVEMEYDALGRLTRDTQYYTSTGSNNMTYEYDAAGRRTRMRWGTGASDFAVTFAYLQTGEMRSVSEAGGALFAWYDYDDLGRRTSLALGGDVVATGYSYADPVTGADTPWLRRQAIHPAGTAHDLTSNFTYTVAGQIKSVSRTNPTDTYAWQDHYNVNRPYTNNVLNQVKTAGSGTPQVAFGYDGRGNLTTSGSDTYTYNSENWLTGRNIGIPVSDDVALVYDASGRLRDYTAAGMATRFVYSGGRIVAEHAGSTNAVLRRYVPGAGADEVLAWYEGAGTTDRRYLVADERGSVIAVTNAAGQATTINRYDEYGNPAPGNAGRFGYTGQASLPELGLYYYKARMYSPRLGRFMQTDPIGYADGMNWYGYVGGDPVNRTDPSGLASTQVCNTHYPTGLGYSGSESAESDIYVVRIGVKICHTEEFGNNQVPPGKPIPSPGKAPAAPQSTIKLQPKAKAYLCNKLGEHSFDIPATFDDIFEFRNLSHQNALVPEIREAENWLYATGNYRTIPTDGSTYFGVLFYHAIWKRVKPGPFPTPASLPAFVAGLNGVYNSGRTQRNLSDELRDYCKAR